MPKYRSIHTKITQSFDFNEMPDDFTRLTWVLLPLGLDREGRGIYNFSWIKSKIFPIRDDISEKKLKKTMEWFANRKNPETKLGMIEIYSVDDRLYFWVPTFKTYQRGFEKEAESILPPPPTENNSGLTPEQVGSKSCLNADAEAEAYTDAEEEVTPNASPAIPLNRESFIAFEKSDNLLLDNIFLEVTSFYPPRDIDRVRETIRLIAARNKLEIKPQTVPKIASVLRHYYLDWIKRKNRSGTPYPRSSLVWLLEWAASGEIPPPVKPEKKVKTVGDLQTEPEPDPKRIALLLVESEEARSAWIRQEQLVDA